MRRLSVLSIGSNHSENHFSELSLMRGGWMCGQTRLKPSVLCRNHHAYQIYIMNIQFFSIRLLTSFYNIHYQYYKGIMEAASGLYTVNNRSSEMKKKNKQ